MNRTINGVLSFVMITLVCCVPSMAATFTWNNTNTTGNYSVASNWVGGIAPPNDNTANIVIDGETGTNVMVSLDINPSIDTLDVSAGDMIVASGGLRTIILQNAATSGVFNNAGTLRADGVEFRLRGNSGTANTNSGVIEAINGGIFRFDSGEDNFTINNSGGIIQAINGNIALRNKDIIVNGGALSLDASSSLFGPDVQVRYTFDDVTTTNAGTIDWIQEITGSNRTKYLAFGGAGSFDNTGTINLIQRSDVAAVNRIHDIRIEDTTAFDNQASGVINITTENAGAITGGSQQAEFSLSAGAAANFTNSGIINITHEAGADPLYVATFRSAGSFSNAGTFNVDGQIASIQMPGNDFTQTAGSLNFANDGSITATNVIIDGGIISGTGTINGNLEVNSTMNLQIGPGGDILTVNGDLTLDDVTSVLDLDLAFGDPVDGAVLVNYTGTLTGRFGSISGLPQGYEIGYGNGLNSAITINFVPEPSSLLLMSLGLCGVMVQRRRRRKDPAC